MNSGKIYLLIILAVQSCLLPGQQPGIYPVSSWIYNPVIFNPAITGSKDFTSADLTLARGENHNSLIISSTTRLKKKIKGYLSVPEYREYSPYGIGGYFFNNINERYLSMGIGASASYHLDLDRQKVSILSFGLGISGIYYTNQVKSNPDPGVPLPASEAADVNIDAGIYYYGKSLFIGLSSTNITGTLLEDFNTGQFEPEARHYYMEWGYKFMISNSLSIFIEPSLIMSATDTTFGDIARNIEPMIKLYFDNFCAGSYLYDKENISLFFLYNYPRIRIGAFIAIPKNKPYIKEDLKVEVSAGINLTSRRSSAGRTFHW